MKKFPAGFKRFLVKIAFPRRVVSCIRVGICLLHVSVLSILKVLNLRQCVVRHRYQIGIYIGYSLVTLEQRLFSIVTTRYEMDI